MSTLIDGSKKTFYIDSNNRVTGTSSDFTVTLNIEPGDEFTHAVVLQAMIPKSYYLIQSGSNTFTVQEVVSRTITIPPGNYNRRSLQSVLVNLLNATAPVGWVYAISYPNTASSADTGKFTYTVTGNSLQPSFVFTTGLHEQLGFNRNSTNTFVADTLTSVNVIKLVREDALYLHSDIVQNKEGNNILQCIFASSDNPPNSNVTYRAIDVEANSKPMVTSTGNVYRFYLTDENDQAIDLNGLNFIISLMLYKQSRLSSLLTGAIKYFTLTSQ